MESEVKFEQQSNVQGKLFEITGDNYYLQTQHTNQMNNKMPSRPHHTNNRSNGVWQLKLAIH